MGISNYQFPPPKDWQDFERLCFDFSRNFWSDPYAELNGRRGQKQKAVDIMVKDHSKGEFIGIQCKCKEQPLGGNVTKKELLTEVEGAKSFLPQLDHLIIITTAPNDVNIQEEARILSLQNQQQGLFAVHVWGWDNFLQKLCEYPDVIQKHWPFWGHNYLISKYKFGARIQNFLSQYLSSEHRDISFGGRDNFFEQINKWTLSGEAPPYALLLGEAGRGKSALLSRWLDEHSSSAPFDTIIFVPISIRFNTNSASVFFLLLANCLAAIEGRSTVLYESMNPEHLREICSNYLAEIAEGPKKVLLILDGLDETDGWELKADLFPLKKGNLRILASCRLQLNDTDGSKLFGKLGWDRKLGIVWKLSLLNNEGVRDVVSKTSLPKDLCLDEVSSLLFEACEGDPLILSLHLADLLEVPEDALKKLKKLNKYPKGLDGYFEQWWEEQDGLFDNKQVQELFNILAFAKGPLLQSELLDLFDDRLSTYDLERVLKLLKRFVTGTNNGIGYTFAHPRFGYFILDKLSSREKDRVVKQFLLWGGNSFKVLKENNTNISQYLLSNYVAHLLDSNLIEEASQTLCKEWQLAHFQFSGNYQGFIDDLERINHYILEENERAIKKELPPPFISLQISLTIIQGRINTASQKLFPYLLERFFDVDLLSFENAVNYLRHYPNKGHRVDALLRLLDNNKCTEKRDFLIDKIIAVFEDQFGGEYDLDCLIKLSRKINELQKDKFIRFISSLKIQQHELLVCLIYRFLNYSDRKEFFRKLKKDHLITPEGGLWFKVLPVFVSQLNQDEIELLYQYVTSSSNKHLIKYSLFPFLKLKELNFQKAIISRAKQEFLESNASEITFIRTAILYLEDLEQDHREQFARELLELNREISDEHNKVLNIIDLLKYLPEREELYSDVLALIENFPRNWFVKVSFLFRLIETASPFGDHSRFLPIAETWMKKLPWEIEKGYKAVDLSNYLKYEDRKVKLKEIFDNVPAYRDPHVRLKTYYFFYDKLGIDRKEICKQEIIQCLRELAQLHVNTKDAHMPGLYWTELAEGSKMIAEILPRDFYPELIQLHSSIEDNAGRALALSGIFSIVDDNLKKICFDIILESFKLGVPTHAGGEPSFGKTILQLIPFIKSAELPALQFFTGKLVSNKLVAEIKTAMFTRGETKATFAEILQEIADFEYDREKVETLFSIWTQIPAVNYSHVKNLLDNMNIHELYGEERHYILLQARLLHKLDNEAGFEELLNIVVQLCNRDLELQYCIEELIPFLPFQFHQQYYNQLQLDIEKEQEGRSYKVLKVLFFANSLPRGDFEHDVLPQIFFHYYPQYLPEICFVTALTQEINKLKSTFDTYEIAKVVKLFSDCSNHLSIDIRYNLFCHSLSIMKEEYHWTMFDHWNDLFKLGAGLVTQEVIEGVFDNVIETHNWWN